MDSVDLYKEVNRFYKIRGDEYAYDYVVEFIKTILSEDVELSELKLWVETNLNHVSFDFGGVNEFNYRKVLLQFVRFLIVSYDVAQVTPEVSVRKRGCTRIYDTFYDLQKSSKYRIC